MQRSVKTEMQYTVLGRADIRDRETAIELEGINKEIIIKYIGYAL